jgi:hypothetical protein
VRILPLCIARLHLFTVKCTSVVYCVRLRRTPMLFCLIRKKYW